MKPIVICDIDGVVLSWESSLPLYLRDRGLDTRKAVKAAASGEWFTVSDVTGLSEAEAIELTHDFADSNYMRSLQGFNDAIIRLPELSKRFTFIGLTAIGSSKSVLAKRKENLELWYPKVFKDVIGVDFGTSKLAELMKFEKTVFIDDNMTYIKEGLLAGHNCIRMDRQSDEIYRRVHGQVKGARGFDIVNSWHAINDLLLTYR